MIVASVEIICVIVFLICSIIQQPTVLIAQEVYTRVNSHLIYSIYPLIWRQRLSISSWLLARSDLSVISRIIVIICLLKFLEYVFAACRHTVCFLLQSAQCIFVRVNDIDGIPLPSSSGLFIASLLHLRCLVII